MLCLAEKLQKYYSISFMFYNDLENHTFATLFPTAFTVPVLLKRREEILYYKGVGRPKKSYKLRNNTLKTPQRTLRP